MVPIAESSIMHIQEERLRNAVGILFLDINGLLMTLEEFPQVHWHLLFLDEWQWAMLVWKLPQGAKKVRNLKYWMLENYNQDIYLQNTMK